MAKWTPALTLNAERQVVDGSEKSLADAIRRGADLRIQTDFLFNEHIDTSSDNSELVREVSDFRVTHLLDDRWVAGHTNLRQPIHPPEGFGPKPSMSFFMYNQNGQQAIARPLLDGAPVAGTRGPSRVADGFATKEDHDRMPKFHEHDSWDADTNAPSSNFIYDFGAYRFWVLDEWEEALCHAADGTVTSGSLDALMDAFQSGHDVKVAVSGLCADLAEDPSQAMSHELFAQTGPGYYQTESRLFSAGTHPLIRVKPAIPLRYESEGWDFGWILPRTDGIVASLIYDPYTLATRRTKTRHAIRWFFR
jgi:hypothetical protein